MVGNRIDHPRSQIGYREPHDFKLEDTLAFLMWHRQEGLETPSEMLDVK